MSALHLLDLGRKWERWPLKVELETPSGAWGQLESTQRLFQVHFRMVVGPLSIGHFAFCRVRSSETPGFVDGSQLRVGSLAL
jgi:hypothetical protein